MAPTRAAGQLMTRTDKAGAVKQALRESEALDRVLARASSVSEARQSALADLIMAAVRDDASRQAASAVVNPIADRADNAGSNVIALPIRGNKADPARATRRHINIDWRAAAALAAALVLGIGVGLSGTASPTFQAVAETVGVSLDRSVPAFNDDGGTMSALDDEDVL
jgi:hypothetical protein